MNHNYLKHCLLKPIKSWRNKYMKSYFRKLAFKENMYESAVSEVAEYTKEAPEVVRLKHHMGPQKEKTYEKFHDQKNLTKEIVEGFYKECEYYLYELPLWNAETMRPKNIHAILKPYLKKFKVFRIADFGGGAGDLCIEFASNGYDVSYCDIGENLINFVDWRFKRRGLNINICKGIDALSENYFDCLVSFDVFEHLKDMDQVVSKMITKLNPGGILAFSGAFSGGTIHLEENEKYDNFKVLNSMLESKGMAFYDAFAQYFIYRKICKK